MTWHVYASDGRRAEWCADPSWGRLGIENKVRNFLGFEGSHQFWQPAWFAARMARGWRLFRIDAERADFYYRTRMMDWWESAAPHHKRFPNLAALEMWIRHVGVPNYGR